MLEFGLEECFTYFAELAYQLRENPEPYIHHLEPLCPSLTATRMQKSAPSNPSKRKRDDLLPSSMCKLGGSCKRVLDESQSETAVIRGSPPIKTQEVGTPGQRHWADQFLDRIKQLDILSTNSEHSTETGAASCWKRTASVPRPSATTPSYSYQTPKMQRPLSPNATTAKNLGQETLLYQSGFKHKSHAQSGQEALETDCTQARSSDLPLICSAQSWVAEAETHPGSTLSAEEVFGSFEVDQIDMDQLFGQGYSQISSLEAGQPAQQNKHSRLLETVTSIRSAISSSISSSILRLRRIIPLFSN